jgi:hypothetical protein
MYGLLATEWQDRQITEADMSTDIFSGRQVKLAPVDTEKMAPLLVRWATDTEYMRLQAGSPARLWYVKSSKDWFENELIWKKTLPSTCLKTMRSSVRLTLAASIPSPARAGLGLALATPVLGQGYGSEALCC